MFFFLIFGLKLELSVHDKQRYTPVGCRLQPNGCQSNKTRKLRVISGFRYDVT